MHIIFMINNQLPLSPRTQQSERVAESLSHLPPTGWAPFLEGQQDCVYTPISKQSGQASCWKRGAQRVERFFFFNEKMQGLLNLNKKRPHFLLGNGTKGWFRSGDKQQGLGNSWAGESWDSSFIPGSTQQATSRPVSRPFSKIIQSYPCPVIDSAISSQEGEGKECTRSSKRLNSVPLSLDTRHIRIFLMFSKATQQLTQTMDEAGR